MKKSYICTMKRVFILLAILASLCACERRDVRTLFVGTYSDGFYAFDFDLAKGEIVAAGEEFGAVAKAPMPNPSFLAVEGNKVYAVSEMPDSSAAVYAWRYGGGGFELVGKQPSGLPEGGEDPCYVSTNGQLLALANYSGGTLSVFKLRSDGSIAPLDSLIYSSAGGPDLERQGSPHVHCALFTPDNKLLFSEFSADAIGAVDITPAGVSHYRRVAQLPADFGPRHLLLNGNTLYCIGELSGDVAVYTYPEMQLRQVVKADESGARGAADIHLSPDGKFLYASLRLKQDGLAVFQVQPDGNLVKCGYQLTGAHPRNFTVLEKWVLVACRDTDQIEVYARNAKNGSLQDTGRRINVPKPVFVLSL